MAKEKAVFWLQPTRSFRDGAPQRENYVSDEAFFAACKKYDAEWRSKYECPGCENPECPQHGSTDYSTGGIMTKPRPLPCPFCGKKPTGEKFCSTSQGPVLICNHCGAEGPPPIKPPEEFEGGSAEERRMQPRSIKAWNTRATHG